MSSSGSRIGPHPWEIGAKLICFTPAGWNRHRTLLDRSAFTAAAGLECGLPIHGQAYVLRGYDESVTPAGVYLLGVRGNPRPDGTETSFPASTFLSLEWCRAIFGHSDDDDDGDRDSDR